MQGAAACSWIPIKKMWKKYCDFPLTLLRIQRELSLDFRFSQKFSWVCLSLIVRTLWYFLRVAFNFGRTSLQSYWDTAERLLKRCWDSVETLLGRFYMTLLRRCKTSQHSFAKCFSFLTKLSWFKIVEKFIWTMELMLVLHVMSHKIDILCMFFWKQLFFMVLTFIF